MKNDFEFNKEAFIRYLERKNSGSENPLHSPFVTDMLENIFSFAEKCQNSSKDQFVYFLSDIIPDMEFGEIAQFMDDNYLTKTGQLEKFDWMQKHRSDECSELYVSENFNNENEKIFSVINEACKLYGVHDISVDITDDGMIDINIVERHCDVQPYLSAVARYDKCDVKLLEQELSRLGVLYTL